MNKRDLKLKEYGISGKRYKELCGFCEQYPEWIDELHYITDALKSVQISDTPMGTGKSDSTANLAIRRAELQKKCELIEQTAIETDAELYQYIIKSVCFEKPFWYLRDIMRIPCSERSFYDRRRYFYYLLDKNKEM